ncbi:SOS response-associated peptidase [Runella sp.]|uniref:SOS response-associated peptidase n=1 Tax=Runella sp. TaxID=1960881 RepID=UPI003D0B86E7
MCFHNSLTATVAEVEQRFEATLEAEKADFQPVYHGNGFEFPTWPVITAQAPKSLQFFRWGLVPRWVKSKEEAEEMRANTLNAKAETLSEKPSFKYALQQSQRCLVPSTGFFEWQTVGKHKYPYHIGLRNQPIFAMAGLWESWHNPAYPDDVWNTFSIITTEANPLMARIHNTKQRMPLILLPGSESIWLQKELDDSALKEIARPLDDSLMEAFTIGRLISNRTADSNVPEVAKPHLYPELSQQQLSLF